MGRLWDGQTLWSRCYSYTYLFKTWIKLHILNCVMLHLPCANQLYVRYNSHFSSFYSFLFISSFFFSSLKNNNCNKDTGQNLAPPRFQRSKSLYSPGGLKKKPLSHLKKSRTLSRDETTNHSTGKIVFNSNVWTCKFVHPIKAPDPILPKYSP